MLEQFNNVIIRHVPREENFEANELAQLASRYKINTPTLKKLIELKGQYAPVEEKEVYLLSHLSQLDWRKPIVELLRNPNASINRRIKNRALNYVILGDSLFKKSVNGNLLTCLSESESYIALAEVHERICGAHQSGEKMKWVLYRQRVYWPLMVKACFKFAKSCEESKKHGYIQHVPATNLHSIVKPWPFRGWALDLIGQIYPPSSKGHKYILVAISYFTKGV